MSIATLVLKDENTDVVCVRCHGTLPKWDSRVKKVTVRGGCIRTMHFHEPCFDAHEFANEVYRRGMTMDDIKVLSKEPTQESLMSVLVKLAKVKRDLEKIRSGEVTFNWE